MPHWLLLNPFYSSAPFHTYITWHLKVLTCTTQNGQQSKRGLKTNVILLCRDSRPILNPNLIEENIVIGYLLDITNPLPKFHNIPRGQHRVCEESLIYIIHIENIRRDNLRVAKSILGYRMYGYFFMRLIPLHSQYMHKMEWFKKHNFETNINFAMVTTDNQCCLALHITYKVAYPSCNLYFRLTRVLGVEHKGYKSSRISNKDDEGPRKKNKSFHLNFVPSQI